MTDEQHNSDQPPEGEDTAGETEHVPFEPDGLEEQLTATRTERDEQRDLAFRAHAELENFRKRVNRDRQEEARYRAAPLVRDLLPVIDNLDRAVHAAGQSGHAESLIEGVEMVLRHFAETLSRHDVRVIPAVGEMFDPNKHEAMTQVPTDEHPPMTIVQEVERGYTLHDRVLRPSKVIVAVAPRGD